MLTDTKLRNLKPKDKLYKVNDRDGLYVAVTAAGAISFRYNYSIHGRQETITFGRYGVGGITLAEARERLGEAKKMIAAGKSPAKEKARDKARVKDAETFGAWAEKWLRGYQMADSTRDMRRSVYERELKPKFGNQKLVEITHEDLRALTDAIVERGAPATAVHVREVVLQVFRWAIERGQKVENPAELVRPTTIAKFEPRDRALTPDEIGLMYQYMERIGTAPSIRAAAKLLLLTMVRKSELADVFQQTLGFIVANTRAAQGEQGFNSQGQPEIPRIVWEELVANALIHRDYFVSAPIRVLVFADRVEIISPGHLPNNLTIENIKAGNSNMRNPILASFAAKLLPYRGLGSGLLRSLRAWPQIELIDDRAGNLFKAIVARPSVLEPARRS